MHVALAPLLATAWLQASPPAAAVEVPVELRGSPESMIRQHRVASDAGYHFVETLEEMRALADRGFLVSIDGGEDYDVETWVFPYGLPEVRTFVEWFSGEYRRACDERLVVTSLTRPLSEQPPNAHELSVHPAGMAVDLRISQVQPCRRFLEDTLLELEAEGVLDLTRERAPPHYHVAIFPRAFMDHAVAHLGVPEPAAARAYERTTRSGEDPSPRTGMPFVYALLIGTALASLVILALVLRRRGGGK
jgi:hypothetical protein